MHMTRDTGLS